MLGIVGVEMLSDRIQGTLIPGDIMPLGDYGVEFVEVTSSYETPEALSVRAQINLWKGDKVIGKLTGSGCLREPRAICEHSGQAQQSRR